jgi:hypothetical protein
VRGQLTLMVLWLVLRSLRGAAYSDANDDDVTALECSSALKVGGDGSAFIAPATSVDGMRLTATMSMTVIRQ